MGQKVTNKKIESICHSYVYVDDIYANYKSLKAYRLLQSTKEEVGKLFVAKVVKLNCESYQN